MTLSDLLCQRDDLDNAHIRRTENLVLEAVFEEPSTFHLELYFIITR